MSLLSPDFDWSTPRAELRTITPEEAAWVLDTRNACFRPINETVATCIAAARVAGKWDVNGDTITFWRSGRLRGGQHRLRACVLAGMPIETYVVFGTD